MKNRLLRKGILIILVLTMLLPILSLFMLSASASSTNGYYEGYSTGTSSEDLHSLTNSSKNTDGTFTTSVSTGAPQITVLIHGFAGRAAVCAEDRGYSTGTHRPPSGGNGICRPAGRNLCGKVPCHRAAVSGDRGKARLCLPACRCGGFPY